MQFLLVFPLFFFTALTVTGSTAVATATGSVGFCYGDDVTLSYGRYNKLGEVKDRTERCGKPHITCKIRDMAAKKPIYDCSPFVLPKGTISWD